MKAAVIFTALFCAAWALPKGQEEPKFKRLYVDPLIPISDIDVPRIVHGREAVAHSIPYQAYLIISGTGGSWLCGGSLISQKYVLTAGHCVDGGTSATVILGAHNVQQSESTQVRITSHSLTTHEGFDEETISNDIGIIELPSPVTLNSNVGVVALATNPSTTYEGDNARVSGWGLTSGTGSTSPVLMEVNSTVISNSECDSIFGIVENYQVCTSGAGGVGSCNGDSGGPLVAGNVQIGIVSYGVEKCLAGYPSAYTRTNSFHDWLTQHTDLTF